MSAKYNFVILVTVFLVLLISCTSVNTESKIADGKKSSGKSKLESNRIAPGIKDSNKVTWQKQIKEKQETIYSGSAKTSFGTFNFKWNVNLKGSTELTTLVSSGSGELQPKEKKIFIQIRNNGTTKLFQEWFPLFNEKKPITLKYISDIPSAELFSAFKDVKLPNESVDWASDQKTQSIQWGKNYIQNHIQYLPGSVTASFGKLNIAWEKKANQSPVLVALEKNQINLKLYILMNEKNNSSELFLEKQFNSNQGSIPYLYYLTKVKTDELIAGFKSAL
jgi:hypothetical protein